MQRDDTEMSGYSPIPQEYSPIPQDACSEEEEKEYKENKEPNQNTDIMIELNDSRITDDDCAFNRENNKTIMKTTIKNREKSRCQRYWMIAPFLFLCISQTMQWIFLVQIALTTRSPAEKVVAIVDKIDPVRFSSAITNAQNIARYVDTSSFYSTMDSAQNIINYVDTSPFRSSVQNAQNVIQFMDSAQFYDGIRNAENITAAINTQRFFDALLVAENTIPPLAAQINTPQFYASFQRVRDQIIPEIVKLLPTIDELPQFLNKSEHLIEEIEALLHRWNFTASDAAVWMNRSCVG